MVYCSEIYTLYTKQPPSWQSFEFTDSIPWGLVPTWPQSENGCATTKLPVCKDYRFLGAVTSLMLSLNTAMYHTFCARKRTVARTHSQCQAIMSNVSRLQACLNDILRKFLLKHRPSGKPIAFETKPQRAGNSQFKTQWATNTLRRELSSLSLSLSLLVYNYYCYHYHHRYEPMQSIPLSLNQQVAILKS